SVATSSGTSSVTFTMAGISPTPRPAPANPPFRSGDAQDQIHTQKKEGQQQGASEGSWPQVRRIEHG
ncbi:hypothetical protein, partial [Myxococcus fulvus]|uniref:hypothetical protein n=1 Tax=Myxococcus fulvus TaxID=33 RepID=UPI0020C154BC